jgi:osmotically-inducible protein OsmY
MQNTEFATGSETKAQSILANSPIPALRRISVTQAPGALVLSGSVSSYYCKQLAQEAVRAVARDRKVINRIRVVDG